MAWRVTRSVRKTLAICVILLFLHAVLGAAILLFSGAMLSKARDFLP